MVIIIQDDSTKKKPDPNNALDVMVWNMCYARFAPIPRAVNEAPKSRCNLCLEILLVSELSDHRLHHGERVDISRVVMNETSSMYMGRYKEAIGGV